SMASQDGLPPATQGGPAAWASPIVTAKPTTGPGRVSGRVSTQNAMSRRARPVNALNSGVAVGEQPAADGEQDHGVGGDDGEAGPRGGGETLDRFGGAERVGVDELGEVWPDRGGREAGQRRDEQQADQGGDGGGAVSDDHAERQPDQPDPAQVGAG